MRRGAEKASLCLDDAVNYSSPEHYCKGSSQRSVIRATHKQGNKEVYKPARGRWLPNCPRNYWSPLWLLSMAAFTVQLLKASRLFCAAIGAISLLAGESIWPYTKTPPLPLGLLTAGAVEITQHTPALSIPTGGWGRSSQTQVCPVSHHNPKPEIAFFFKQFSITAHPKKGNEDYTV